MPKLPPCNLYVTSTSIFRPLYSPSSYSSRTRISPTRNTLSSLRASKFFLPDRISSKNSGHVFNSCVILLWFRGFNRCVIPLYKFYYSTVYRIYFAAFYLGSRTSNTPDKATIFPYINRETFMLNLLHYRHEPVPTPMKFHFLTEHFRLARVTDIRVKIGHHMTAVMA